MATTSSNSLLDSLRQHHLLDAKQLEELNSLHFSDPKALAGELIRRGWLSPYQANQLLNGKGQELVLGSYILLERLGEGGMGQVFKARHRNLGRISAIKLIRKERLASPDAVRRFQREVRSAAALSHPNIVRVYDADEIAGTHLMVMEYIDGAIDLAKLVKKNGPLPVEKACEYIRQAALGLQHAYERGMVHRDIKPANLLLTTDAKVVKILDMGLARLDQPSDEEDDKSSTMTQEGAVMGTPDYIAPEQAMDSHTVDIRADLYSLGCAFYYLLTGRGPFPGGTMVEKLMKHQLEEPLPVEKLRPEVPPEVARVVRKLVAKKPVDRYQTPAEVAAALALVSGQSSGFAVAAIANALTIAEAKQAEAEKEVGRDTFASAYAYIEKRDDTVAFEPSQPLQSKPKNQRWLLIGSVGGFVALVGLAVVSFLAFRGPAEKKLPQKEDRRFAIPPPKKILLKVDDAWLKEVAAMPAEKQVEAVAKKLQELNPDFDGKIVTHKVEGGVVTDLQFFTDNVTDISPLLALPGLQRLFCNGTQNKGQLANLSPLRGMQLTQLRCNNNTQIFDLSPLKDMKLTHLECGNTKVSDLSPLKDMKLTLLTCNGTQVSDLSPLKDMKLTDLYCEWTKVSDLSPLKDMKLTTLWCNGTQVSDLSPLKGMKLTNLDFRSTKVSDLSPLKGLPLKELRCDFKPFRDTEILRSITTLDKIAAKPAKDFWIEVDEKQAAFEAWCKQVAAMTADKQVEAVAKKLMEMNPGFDGKVRKNIEGNVVTELEVVTDNVTDISAVRALIGLKTLDCSGTHSNSQPQGQLADLSPLKEMKLTELQCNSTKVSDLFPLKDMKLTILNLRYTNVSDLSPLKDIKLTNLDCRYTKVSDLSPLKDMKLVNLHCSYTKVSDLSPLKDMKLTELWCWNTHVSDLLPLKGMPLTNLYCQLTNVSDLSPLRGMPLKELQCDFKPGRDAEILRSIKTLEKINTKPAKEFWKEVDEKTFTNGIGMKFVWIPPGTFMMGSPKEEKERQPDEIQHKVTLTRGFYMGVYTVTQEQWQEIMGKNPSSFKGEKNLPVETVSWGECQEFIKKLREKDKKPYRLPTEAEWEFACRARTKTPFYFGETISTDQANYNGEVYGNGKKGVRRGKTTPVDTFPANAWGLHDMHGNLSQWCQDRLGDYPQKDVVDPQGPEKGETRVLRGGSWGFNPENCRSAYRNWNVPGTRYNGIGFRLCFFVE